MAADISSPSTTAPFIPRIRGSADLPSAFNTPEMKRRLSPGANSASAPARRGRQPQVSCDFCRQKKLKCGPQRPCLNCLTRSFPCDGGVTSQPAAGDADSRNPLKEIQERLRRLEQAVFPSTEPGPPLYQNIGSMNDSARPSSS